MTAQFYGGIALDLLDGPIRTQYSHNDFDGKPTARLILGSGTQSIAVSVTRCTPETLDELEAAVAELKAWVQRQAMKEVA